MAPRLSPEAIIVADYPAGFWIRVLAALIDSVVVLPIAVWAYFNLTEWKLLPLQVGLIVLGILYKVVMEGVWGATLGKMACKICVVTEYGRKITLGQALGRNLVHVVSSVLETVAVVLLFSDSAFRSADSVREVGRILQTQSLQSFDNLVGLFALVDHLFVAFTERKTALHDMWARTRCVYVVPAGR